MAKEDDVVAAAMAKPIRDGYPKNQPPKLSGIYSRCAYRVWDHRRLPNSLKPMK